MSLASAYQKFGKKSRQNLSTSSKGKNLSSLMEQGGSLIGEIFGVADEAFDITENLQSWENFESGQEYLGISGDDISKPLKKTQRMFSKPEDVYKDAFKIKSKGKEFSSREIRDIGALSSSNERAIFEGFMDGDLSSKSGKQYSDIGIGKSSHTGYNPSENRFMDMNVDDTLTRSMGKDPNMKISEWTPNAPEKKVGLYQATSSSDRKYGMDSLAPLPAKFTADPYSKHKYGDYNQEGKDMLTAQAEAAPGVHSKTPEVGAASLTDKWMQGIEKMDEKQLQASITEGYNNAEALGGKRTWEDARANYYKLMSENTSVETGMDYFTSLINRRAQLRDSGNKEMK